MSKMESAAKEESKHELEDQFILRLPPEQAKIIHKLLRKKPKKIKKHLSIEFTDLRHAIVKVHKKYLLGKLIDFPTIIESDKTIDGVHLYKTADICQMLLCQNPDTNDERRDLSTKKPYQYLHGLTPPLKNVVRDRFRKTLRNKDDAEEAADIEKELLLLLRTDNEAVATRFEFIYDEKINAGRNKFTEETEMTLFGERLSDIDSEKNSSGSVSSASEINDLMDFTN